jgi:hypothetical protein
MSVALYHCFQGLNVYGKDAEAMESVVYLFNMVLSDYTWPEIETAFRYYWKNFKGLPEPADIANIIERKGKPPFERSVYITIQKKDGSDRSQEEWQYIRDYERFIVTGEKDY